MTKALLQGSWPESIFRKVFLGILLILLIPGPALAKSPSGTYVPEYSRLFEQSREEKAKGHWQKALRTLGRIYDTEVPVQAFYDTLDRHKLEIISTLRSGSALSTGKQIYPMKDLKQYFSEVLLPQPETFFHRPTPFTDLPSVRLLYLYAVQGRDRKKPKNPLLVPTAPYVDLTKALSAGDPWSVSAALFLARKGCGRIKPQAVIDRWQARPDLWDDICTEQALLFLAQRSPKELRGLKVEDNFAADQLSDLKPLKVDEPAQVEVLFFRRGSLGLGQKDYLSRARCKVLSLTRVKDDKEGSRPPRCRQGVFVLDPGRFNLTYNQGQERGKSRPFEVKTGTLTRVVMAVRGDI